MVNRQNAINNSVIIIAKIGGIISIISSFLLVRHILHKKWADLPLSSIILFGISLVDIIGVFFGFVMGTWMMGEGIEYMGFPSSSPLVAGNTATCTAQGFFLIFCSTYFVTAYAGLGILYSLIVRRGWTKSDLKERKIQVRSSLNWSSPLAFF